MKIRKTREPTTPFGRWLRDQRNVAGLSQSQLATRLRTSRSTVYGWEANGCRPGDDLTAALASTFGLPLDQVCAAISDGREARRKPVVATRAAHVSCDRCERLRECRRYAADGLPILCETVTESDWDAAWVAGLESELLESRMQAVRG